MGSAEVSLKIGNDWDEALLGLGPTVDLKGLLEGLDEAFAKYPGQVNPPAADVFRAFRETPLAKVKVVMIGQDPYPGHGVADGLAFSARAQRQAPASLVNLNREWNAEFHKDIPIRNDLIYFANQGVFLYNTCLISKDGTPMFFAGNEIFSVFSQAVIAKISEAREHVVFILLGRQAQKYEAAIDNAKHVVLKAAHPSPLSANEGFFGSGIFRECNKDLSGLGLLPIDWLGLSLV